MKNSIQGIIRIAQKIIFFMCQFIFCLTGLFAQQLTPAVLNSGGSQLFNGNYAMTWSLGEVVIHTYTKDNITLTQGFLQPRTKIEVSIDDPLNKHQVRIFPNPTSRWLVVEAEDRAKDLTFEITDLLGRFYLNQELQSPATKIDLDEIPGSTLLLTIRNENAMVIGTWKVQKIW